MARRKLEKITLREATAGGCDGVLFYCDARGCGHSGEMPLDQAIAIWGVNARLDQMNPPCSKCSSRETETRPRWPAVGPGGF